MSQPELWVISERRLAHIEPTTQQLITKAKSIAGTTFKVVTILLEAPTDHLEDELTPYAPDEIRIARDERFPTATDAEQADALAQHDFIWGYDYRPFHCPTTSSKIANRTDCRLFGPTL